MKKWYLACLIAVLAIAAFLGGKNIAFGLESDPKEKIPDSQGQAEVRCDEYYKFGSIDAEILPERDNYKPGESIAFRGKMKNNNDLPVVGGGLYVQLLRRNETEQDTNGDHLLDEFFVEEGVSLAAGEEREFKFNWKIPEGSVGGEYKVASFFVVDRKYNLSGLTFWNHTYAGFSLFNVEGEKGGVYFDRNKTLLNNEAFELRAMHKPLGATDKIEVKAPLVNSTAKGVNVKLNYKLYYWDGLLKENIVDSKEERIYLEPNGTKEITYIIPKPEKSVYYLSVGAEEGGRKSILNVRPMTENSQARLNFSGISKFPLNKNEKATSFVCFHNTSFGDQLTGRIEQMLKDKQGNVIDKLEYSGPISPNIQATKKEFSIGGQYDYLVLETKAYDGGGKLVDEVKLEYDCSKFKSGYCSAASQGGGVRVGLDKRGTAIKVAIALSGIVTFLIAYILRKRSKKVLAGIVLVVGLLGMAYLLFSAGIGLSYVIKDPTLGATNDMGIFGRMGIWTNISYSVNLKQGGQFLVDGQTLPNANKLDFSFSKDGEWGATGAGMDTPAVYWDGWTGAGCNGSYWISGGECEIDAWYAFVRCNTPATRTVQAVSGPVSCSGNGASANCTITGYTTPGNPIKVRTVVSQTDCSRRAYSSSDGKNGGNCAWACFAAGGPCQSTTIGPDGTNKCWNVGDCWCNAREGLNQCPLNPGCVLEEEKNYPGFVPYNERVWTFYYPNPSCSGNRCDGTPVTLSNGESVCGSNLTLETCSNGSWVNSGAPCTCSCAGNKCDNSPVTLTPGQSICGTSLTNWRCDINNGGAYWTNVGTPCSCTCSGNRCDGSPVTLTNTQTVCGTDSSVWRCDLGNLGTNWVDTNAPCACGACGSANGGTFITAPTTNLCSRGTPSAVAGSGPWNWTCLGSNGGVDSSPCSATKICTPDCSKWSSCMPTGGGVTCDGSGMQVCEQFNCPGISPMYGCKLPSCPIDPGPGGDWTEVK